MNIQYLYKSSKSSNSKTAIIVLPEIFGLTDFITSTTDRFAEEFKVSAYALDFFFQLTGEPNKFDYNSDEGAQTGMDLMKKMTGEDFVNIFEQAVDHIVADLGGVEEIVVCGFCFGGRLAYLSSIETRVKKIISFYGAGANKPNYYSDSSAIEQLCEARSSDESLQVLSFYGAEDDSINQEDRDKTKKAMQEANISYHDIVYPDTGHAFFNNTRQSMYNEESANKAWREIIKFISN